MRTLRLAIAFFAASLLAPAFARADDPKPAPPPTESVYVEFAGVEAAEAPAVAKAVGAIDGVASFEWTVPQTEAKVVRAVGKADAAALDKAAKSAGADSALLEPIATKAMTFVKKLYCQGCVGLVVDKLRAVPGVKDATVPEEMTTVRVVYDTRKAKVKDFEDALAAVGRPVQPETPPTK